jgi:hypothetical protein
MGKTANFEPDGEQVDQVDQIEQQIEGWLYGLSKLWALAQRMGRMHRDGLAGDRSKLGWIRQAAAAHNHHPAANHL